MPISYNPGTTIDPRMGTSAGEEASHVHVTGHCWVRSPPHWTLLAYAETLPIADFSLHPFSVLNLGTVAFCQLG